MLALANAVRDAQCAFVEGWSLPLGAAASSTRLDAQAAGMAPGQIKDEDVAAPSFRCPQEQQARERPTAARALSEPGASAALAAERTVKCRAVARREFQAPSSPESGVRMVAEAGGTVAVLQPPEFPASAQG